MTRKPDPAVVDALGRVTDFDADTVRRLASAGRPINIPERWAVMVEHTPADKAYVILSGVVEIRRDGTTIASLSAGDVIGEMAIVSGHLRNATVVATTPVQALHLTEADIETLLEEDPGFAAKLQAVATDRLG